jgi:4-oxalocrotonate tautomerase
MPYIAITVAGQSLDREQANTLIVETTRLMHELMGKRADLTSVRIEQTPGHSWGIGAALIGERSGQGALSAAHMDITITAGTNTAEEKAAMVAAGYQLMQDVLGAIHEACYVVIHELPADAWGFAGQTQAARVAARGRGI